VVVETVKIVVEVVEVVEMVLMVIEFAGLLLWRYLRKIMSWLFRNSTLTICEIGIKFR